MSIRKFLDSSKIDGLFYLLFLIVGFWGVPAVFTVQEIGKWEAILIPIYFTTLGLVLGAFYGSEHKEKSLLKKFLQHGTIPEWLELWQHTKKHSN